MATESHGLQRDRGERTKRLGTAPLQEGVNIHYRVVHRCCGLGQGCVLEFRVRAATASPASILGSLECQEPAPPLCLRGSGGLLTELSALRRTHPPCHPHFASPE